jgi:hypothetical protein
MCRVEGAHYSGDYGRAGSAVMATDRAPSLGSGLTAVTSMAPLRSPNRATARDESDDAADAVTDANEGNSEFGRDSRGCQVWSADGYARGSA